MIYNVCRGGFHIRPLPYEQGGLPVKNNHIKYPKWLSRHTASLKGKTVVVTGSTGGLGKALCHYLAWIATVSVPKPFGGC